MTKIYVDADACPVKAEVERVADRLGTPVVVVSNGGIRPSSNANVDTVVVSGEADAADRWIAERIGPSDICVTNDIPLAQRCVEAGAVAVRPDGKVLTEANIGNALATRDLMADLRAANPLSSGGGPKGFTKKDRSSFLQTLDRLVRAAQRGTGGW